MNRTKLIVVCGPTGSGKTAVAIDLAEALGGEIIGADSMQIRRFMDIGTAKPTAEEQARITHHLIDVVDPDEEFDAAQYAALAGECAQKLARKGILPIVAGGTGFYIKTLLGGLLPGAATDRQVRDRLKSEAAANGGRFLYERLATCDPRAASRIHPHDTFRIIRALEVYEVTGQPISTLQQGHRFGDHRFDALKIGLDMDREVLYERIDRRVEQMMAAGLIDEVKGLLDRGYDPGLKAMQSIGYRHIHLFLTGALSLAEAVRIVKRDTRRYAKRQMTWFKKDPDVIWMPPDEPNRMRRLVTAFLNGKGTAINVG